MANPQHVALEFYDVLDAALRSRYLPLDRLDQTGFWDPLPVALKSAFQTGATFREFLPLIWVIRNGLFGKPVRSDIQSEALVHLMLGFRYLAWLEGRVPVDDLLSGAFHIADSYVCKVEARPFSNLQKDLQEGQAVDDRIHRLFEPFHSIAKYYAEHWGLKAATASITPLLPLSPPA